MRCKIIYEDADVLVIHKPAGFPVQTKNIGSMDCVSELKSYLKKQGLQNKTEQTKSQHNNSQPYLGIIHRLDQPVEGIMVFGKNEKASAKLSKQVSGEDDSKMLKCYEALVYGQMPAEEGELLDYLCVDSKTNTSYIAAKEEKTAKECKLIYQVIDTSLENNNKEGNVSHSSEMEASKSLPDNSKIQKVSIKLLTGRHHQIRLQLSNAGAPILGDQKYGNEESIAYSKAIGIRNVALRAVHLEFVHPTTNKKMVWKLSE